MREKTNAVVAKLKMPTDPARIRRSDPGSQKIVLYGLCIKFILTIQY